MKLRTTHPITAIVVFISFIISSMLFSSPIIILSLLILLLTAIIYFGEKQKLKYFIFIFFMFFFVSLTVNFLFTNSGSTIIFQISNIPFIGFKRLSLELIVFTLTGTFRLTLLLLIFSFTSIISSEDRMMSFFSKFLKRFPLLLSFSIRLMPKLTRDYKRLEHIFKLRGFASSNTRKTSKKKKNIIRRIKEIMNPKLMSVLIRTLLMNSLEDSLQYAESMQSRGFGDIKRRSSFSKDIICISDYLITFFSLIYIIFSLFLYSNSIGTKSIYPKFKMLYYLNNNELLAVLGIIILNVVIFTLCYLKIKEIKLTGSSYVGKS